MFLLHLHNRHQWLIFGLQFFRAKSQNPSGLRLLLGAGGSLLETLISLPKVSRHLVPGCEDSYFPRLFLKLNAFTTATLTEVVDTIVKCGRTLVQVCRTRVFTYFSVD